MSQQQVIKLLQSLPEDLQREVTHYIEFLTQKAKKLPQKTAKNVLETARKNHFGHAKGKIWMASDFDVPLDDFKDYWMPMM